MPKQTTCAFSRIDPDAVALPLFVLRQSYAPTSVAPHQHSCAQLIHAASGVLEVVTDEGRWIVPPQRGVWVPPGTVHQVLSKKRFDLCTLYVSRYLAKPMATHCQVVQVSPLLSELLLKGAELGVEWVRGGAQERLLRVALDQMAFQGTEPLHLPKPKDKRIVRISDALQANPADTTELRGWAQTVGASERTLARIFKDDTGLGFSQWRRQCRLMHAVNMLADGRSVTQVAMDVGYGDMSSFVRDFRLALGSTPGQYF
jgi:AraC-like DNA-binding protein/mannose-6-phosphate isomerase-like protein (cupin superfamily)